jgi:nucleotide-binding universal stress UspA family protein
VSFERIVCGIDLNEASVDAARQALRLAPPGSSILLVTVLEPPIVMDAGAIAGEWETQGYDPEIFEALEESARENLERARTTLRGATVETRIETGTVARTLVGAAEEAGASLIALGVREEHRLLGILGGSVSHWLLHHAPCSVLVARPAGEPDSFPRSIVVGTDGSEPAARAVALASELASRLGVGLRAVVAEPGKRGHGEAARRQLEAAGVTDLAEDERGPVEALASVEADLIVVGSRGHTGLRALGSVSERVAHQARCSVLIAR